MPTAHARKPGTAHGAHVPPGAPRGVASVSRPEHGTELESFVERDHPANWMGPKRGMGKGSAPRSGLNIPQNGLLRVLVVTYTLFAQKKLIPWLSALLSPLSNVGKHKVRKTYKAA